MSIVNYATLVCSIETFLISTDFLMEFDILI